MAALRQSFIAIGYVLIILPRVKSGAEVLMQRDLSMKNQIEDLELEIESIK